MKKGVKIAGGVLAVGALAVGAFVASVAVGWPPTYPDTPRPDISASDDPEVIAQGEYLFHSVAHCSACHSKMDDYIFAEPGTQVPPRGGHEWHMGPLGTLRAPNLASEAVQAQSDQDLARVIRYGIKSDDTPGTLMIGVGPMSDKDLTALVSYMRTLEPIEHDVPPSEVGLMGKFLFTGPMGFFGEPHEYDWELAEVAASETPSLERGKYLAEGPAFCVGCHTEPKYEDGKLTLEAPMMSGRSEFTWPDETEEGFEFAGPNLTPHPDAGHLKDWTKEQFFDRFRNTRRVHKGSVMPWEAYANMTDSDLESIWLYLQALEPADKVVGPPRREKGWKPS